MSIESNLEKISAVLKQYPDTKLVAVTKHRSAEDINHAISLGISAMGENRIQEAEEKLPLIKNNIEKHFIGKLQTNKARKAVILFDVIESVDSLKLANKINDECLALGKVMPVFLQVNISNDPNKSGFETDEIIDMCKIIVQLKNIKVVGLMTIPKVENSLDTTRSHFRKLKELFNIIVQEKIFGDYFKEVSMGMSDDFKIALEEGATVIRLGRSVFE